MHEMLFPLTEDQIFAAETQRTKGYVAEAAKATRPIVDFPAEQFAALSENEKKMEMMASRIYVVATTSKANRSWGASSVAHNLNESREAILKVYRNPAVQDATSKIKSDTKDNPYEFSTEMGRDEVEYSLILAALTGNTFLLNDSIAKMDEIIQRAQDVDAKALAQFQRDRIVHRIKPTKETFAELNRSAKESITSAEAVGNWERVSTVASRYSIEALKRGNIIEAAKGIKASVKAAVSDRSTVTILPRQTVRELTENVRHWNWHRTAPKGTDYSDLRLP